MVYFKITIHDIFFIKMAYLNLSHTSHQQSTINHQQSTINNQPSTFNIQHAAAYLLHQ